jgi:hypothetical protein
MPVMETITCAICERTLLMGERATRYSPHGDADFVDVCPLCQDVALEHGWIKEGAPTTPSLKAERRRRRLLTALFERGGADEPVLNEPILRRLSPDEQAIVEAAELFNGSSYRRTVAGIAKSLGEPNVSCVPLSGVNREVVVTFAWDISWYQYRVAYDGAQPVRLAERGLELDELDAMFKEWNAQLGADGRVLPDIARL